VFHHTAKYLL